MHPPFIYFYRETLLDKAKTQTLISVILSEMRAFHFEICLFHFDMHKTSDSTEKLLVSWETVD